MAAIELGGESRLDALPPRHALMNLAIVEWHIVHTERTRLLDDRLSPSGTGRPCARNVQLDEIKSSARPNSPRIARPPIGRSTAPDLTCQSGGPSRMHTSRRQSPKLEQHHSLQHAP